MVLGRIGGTSSKLKRLLAAKGGNFHLITALLAVPLMVAVGSAIDFTMAFNVRQQLQVDLDSALIQAVKEVDNLEVAKLQDKVNKYFAAATRIDKAHYSLSSSEIIVSKVSKTIQATARANVATTFMRLAGWDKVPITVMSAVKGPSTGFLNVYVVIDKSPSMLLAANSSDQTSMRGMIGCEFACHDTADPVSYGGKTYPTYYAFAKSKNITLRADVAVNAVKNVLDLVDNANTSAQHVKIGLYKLGTTTTEIIAPAFNTSAARTALSNDSSGLNSATSEPATYFDVSLKKLKSLVGSAGDGTSESKPLKLVLLVTDGIQSERNWVVWWNKPNYDVLGWKSSQSDSTKQTIWKVITPLNPAWCKDIKDNAVTFGVLYTQYLPITSDWGYNATVGDKMSTSYFSKTWGGTMHTDLPSTITRQAYIPYALKDCASDTGLFMSASSPSDIEAGLKAIFNQYLSRIRLTQ